MLISTEKLKNFFSSFLVRSWLHLTMTSLFLIISPINHVVETCEIVDCLDSSNFYSVLFGLRHCLRLNVRRRLSVPHDIHLQTTNWRDEFIPHQISSTVGMDAMRWLASIHGRMFDFWCLAFLSVWIFTAICIGCTIGMVRARPTLSISRSVCFQLRWSHDEYSVPSSPSLVCAMHTGCTSIHGQHPSSC